MSIFNEYFLQNLRQKNSRAREIIAQDQSNMESFADNSGDDSPSKRLKTSDSEEDEYLFVKTKKGLVFRSRVGKLNSTKTKH